jgi:multidrug resistance efflux pump
LSYFTAFTDEIDAELAANRAAADEAEADWRRRQDLLAG